MIGTKQEILSKIEMFADSQVISEALLGIKKEGEGILSEQNNYWLAEAATHIEGMYRNMREMARYMLVHHKDSAPPLEEGWIPWAGGDMPIDGHVSIKIKRRDGGVHTCIANDCLWTHGDEDYDIVAYFIKEQGND